MIPNRDGTPSESLSVIWAVYVRDIRRKRNPWRFEEAHSTRIEAKAHAELIRTRELLETAVHRCAVGERV